MKTKITIFSLALIWVLLLNARVSEAQISAASLGNAGSVYFSIGVNSPSYKATTIHINQGTGNVYDLENAKGDKEISGNSSILNHNLRVGYYFNKSQTLGIELNYDPVNYHLTDGQNIQMTGTLENATVNKTVAFAASDENYYYLNGSNLILVNLVKRFGLYRNKMRTLSLDALGKAGVGPAMPRVMNSFDGKVTDHPSFQYGGWNTGLEAAIRATVVRHVYLELAGKYDYASYNIDIYKGTATQKLITTEFVASLGFTFATTKHNPLFEKAHKERRVITIGNVNHADD